MANFKFLIVPFALVMWFGTLMTFVHYSQDLSKAVQERELEIICNYAVDAAVDEMVDGSSDLSMDYNKNGYASVDPEVALDMFVTMFLKAYNMSPSEENIALVRSKYLPMFCVAAYDGYYIATSQHVYNDSSTGGNYESYDLRFTPKMPYIYEDAGKVYALNLKGRNCYMLDYHEVTDSNTKLKLDRNCANPLSLDGNLKVINAVVSDSLMNTVYNVMDGNVRGSILIPSVMGDVYSTMPIRDITVFAYVANIPLGWGGESVDTFGIGGAQIKQSDYVGVYEEGGKKHYQYLSKLVKHNFERDKIIAYYDTAEEAAEKGYYYDFRYR